LDKLVVKKDVNVAHSLLFGSAFG